MSRLFGAQHLVAAGPLGADGETQNVESCSLSIYIISAYVCIMYMYVYYIICNTVYMYLYIYACMQSFTYSSIYIYIEYMICEYV